MPLSGAMVVIQVSVSFGDFPRDIGCDVEGGTGVIGVDGYTGLTWNKGSCHRILCEGNGHTFSSCIGGSERKDSISGCNRGIF